MDGFFRQGVLPRSYQLSIALSALEKGNTLVVLPTGLGKTLIAFLAMEKKVEAGRVFFLAPTKPLVQQHHKTFLSMTTFPEEKTAIVTGEVAPKNRAELWKRQICFSTPQTLQNDIAKGRTDAKCSLCIIDEAHRSIGKYAYTYVSQKCVEEGALLLGLTASPGGDRRKIQEIIGALGIQNIEIRTAEDSDVAPYVKPLEISHVRVPLGARFSEVRTELSSILADNVKYLANYHFHAPIRSKKGLVDLRAKILRSSESVRFSALSYYTTVFNLVHMLELIETQGLATFLAYVKKLEGREETKAKRRIFSDARFKRALELCIDASEHPKLEALLALLAEKKGEKILVFAQYRTQVQTIVDTLMKAGWTSERFLGKKDGVTAQEQRETVERFRQGKFEVMVATSIGEEGLDIPAVDTVVFFEPIPSEIRSIQRRGRAGRLQAGKVVVLITSGTKDEASFHSSRRKEESMKRIVGRMKQQFSNSQGTSEAPKKPIEGEKGKRETDANPSGLPTPEAPREKKAEKPQRKLTDF